MRNKWEVKMLNGRCTPRDEKNWKRRRLRRTWGQDVNEAMMSTQLSEEDVHDRQRWSIVCGK